MIAVHLSVWITAQNDDEADQVIRTLRDAGVEHPATPIVSITELSRELER